MRQTIMIGLAVLATLGAGDFVGAEGSHKASARYEFSQAHMGTRFRILLYAETENAANHAAAAAFARIAELDSTLSDYKSDSELSRLSGDSPTHVPIRVSDDLWHVLSRAQQLAQETDGAFDVTVGPMSRLWRRARRRKELPPTELLSKARAATGYQHVVLDPCAMTASLQVANMRFDLGAIAKGYAADEAMRVLVEHNIRATLIDAGGDIVAGEPPPGRQGWSVAIADFSNVGVNKKPSTIPLALYNAAIATSGDLFQHLVIDGQRYSHIIDPRTGIGLTGQTTVTVIASDGMTADSLASAVSVLCVDKGFDLIERTPGAACRFAWIDEQGETQVRDSKRISRYVATPGNDNAR